MHRRCSNSSLQSETSFCMHLEVCVICKLYCANALYKYFVYVLQISDLEKEKTMLELEVKELIARHKADLQEKTSKITQVCYVVGCLSYFISYV